MKTWQFERTRFGLSLTPRGVSPERRGTLGAAVGGRHHRYDRSIAEAASAKCLLDAKDPFGICRISNGRSVTGGGAQHGRAGLSPDARAAGMIDIKPARRGPPPPPGSPKARLAHAGDDDET
ncbi:hypothetical protein [Burkholderia sp. F1]|uniref:hypothetical protein n=1 Tax=Burkholderia sp. F1 TaxID=3366817 RepID=UPI003D72197B